MNKTQRKHTNIMPSDIRSRRGGNGQAPNIIDGILRNDVAEINTALSNDRDAINIRDPETGKTPLSLAISLQNLALVRLLVGQPRLDPLIKDYGDNATGRAPFDSVDWALFVDDEEILRMIQFVVNPAQATSLSGGPSNSFNVSPFRKPECDR